MRTVRILLSMFSAAFIVAATALVPAASAVPMPVDSEGPPGALAESNSYLSAFRSYDLTWDDWPDLLTRNASTGELSVHRHSGSVNGASTFLAPVTVGVGWTPFDFVGVGNFVSSDAKDGPDDSERARFLGDLIARRAGDGALIILPHSGTFNGTSTWLSPVVVGSGWNTVKRIWVADVTLDGYDDIVAMDNSFTIWVYPNTRNLDGLNTFGQRIKVSAAVGGPSSNNRVFFSFSHWYRNAPDFASVDLNSGAAWYSPKRRIELREDTWYWNGTGAAVFTYGDLIGYSMATLADVSGNGNDDILVRRHSGELALLPVRSSRLGQNNSLDPVVNLGGNWNAYDVIT